MLCDVQTGDVRHFDVPSCVRQRTWTVCPDGSRMACVDSDELLVYDLKRLHPIAKMETLPGLDHYHFWSTSGLSFSPDAKELAAQSRNRLVVWDNRGKAILTIPSRAMVTIVDCLVSVQWLPDQSGWFVNGRALVLRDAGQAVWAICPPSAYTVFHVRLLDQDHVLAPRGSRSYGTLVKLDIPWGPIREALKTRGRPSDSTSDSAAPSGSSESSGSANLPIVTKFRD